MTSHREVAWTAHRDAAARADAIRTIVSGVVVEAVRSARAGGVAVMEDRTPEGELVCEWLTDALGESRIWRASALASNVHGPDAADAQMLGVWHCARDRNALIAHPASKTALLLGGPLPRVDIFPLGDLYASQLSRLAGGWSVPESLGAMLERVGGVDVLDAALARFIDMREPAGSALAGLGTDAAGVLTLYENGRYSRLRPRLVPKLTARTFGVDLFD